MEARTAKLEECFVEARNCLSRIETRLDQTATKSDIANFKAEMYKCFLSLRVWLVGTSIASIAIMTFWLNNAVSNIPTIQPAPIIINVPMPITTPQKPQ